MKNTHMSDAHVQIKYLEGTCTCMCMSYAYIHVKLHVCVCNVPSQESVYNMCTTN